MSDPPWAAAQEAMIDLGIDAVLLSGVAAAEAIGGHRRIAVFQSDPPAPGFVLRRAGVPQVCTPDPDGAQHLPADHVHPVAFDGRALARALPAWLGAAASGTLAVDRGAPGAFALVEASCPAATLVDAQVLLDRLGIGATARDRPAVRDPDTVVDARRARVRAAADSIGADTWWCTTPEAIRMITGLRGPEAAAVVGTAVVADASVEAALDHLPARGRVAVDRITISERRRLRAARPALEVVDAGPLVLAGSVPRSAAEVALLHEGYRRTEAAVEAARRSLVSAPTERECCDALAAAGAGLGLEPHIDHVFTAIPRSRASVPWLRGDWTGRAPWRQLTSARSIGAADLVGLDAGFFFDGYVTDFGRTFTGGRDASAGEGSLARRWTDVADRVTAAIRPGATAADLRGAALDGWRGSESPWPFGLYVAHGVGFGGVVPPFAGTDLGVAVETTMVLHPGDVLMVEPYVFEDGIGGFRAERCAAVTDTGADVWTTLPIEQLEPLAVR